MFDKPITDEQYDEFLRMTSEVKIPKFAEVQKETKEKANEMKAENARINAAAMAETKALTKQIEALVKQRSELQKPFHEKMDAIKKQIDALYVTHYRSEYPASFDQAVKDAKDTIKSQLRLALDIPEARFNRLWDFAEEHTSSDTDRWDDVIEHSHFMNAIDFIKEMIQTLRDIEVIESNDEE